MLHRITDRSSAYSNSVNIPEGHRWPQAWQGPAAAFRERAVTDGLGRIDLAYGEGERHRLDLFRPANQPPRGLVVFVHGGYWMALDKSYWSHFASGPLAHGYAVAIPSYSLCPRARIAEIRLDVARAITDAAELVEGPVRLIGHSAGGHLVSRMVCEDTGLPNAVLSRIAHVVSLSGLHDLRPLMKTDLNHTLRLDEDEARSQSPALLAPVEGLRLTCWVGAAERAEFIRQNALLANIWRGMGAATSCVEEPDRHHFNVLDGLSDPDHPLTRTLLHE